MKTYAPDQVRGQLRLFAHLYLHSGKKQASLVRRSELPKHLQPHVDQLLSQGIIEKDYDKFTSFSGKQKVCWLRLVRLCPATQPMPAPKPKPKAPRQTAAQPVLPELGPELEAPRRVPAAGINLFRYPDEASREAERRLREAAGIFL